MIALSSEKTTKELRAGQVKLLEHRLDDIERLLSTYAVMSEFDDFIFRDVCDAVVVEKDKATYKLKCGIERVVAI